MIPGIANIGFLVESQGADLSKPLLSGSLDRMLYFTCVPAQASRVVSTDRAARCLQALHLHTLVEYSHATRHNRLLFLTDEHTTYTTIKSRYPTPRHGEPNPSPLTDTSPQYTTLSPHPPTAFRCTSGRRIRIESNRNE